MSAEQFFDTNILIYAFSSGDARSEKAFALMAEGGVVSVQVLNEFVSVMLRKLGRSWEETEAALGAARAGPQGHSAQRCGAREGRQTQPRAYDLNL
jgi:predicted nucleic acid-binding protein